MNKTVSFIAILLSFYACNPAQPDDTELRESGIQAKNTYTMRDLFEVYILGVQIINCDKSGENCFPEIIVRPSNENLVTEFINSVDDNTEDEFFEGEQYYQLFPEMESYNNGQTLSQLRSGDLDIQSYFQTSDSKTYYFVKDSNDSIDMSSSNWMDDVVATLVIAD